MSYRFKDSRISAQKTLRIIYVLILASVMIAGTFAVPSAAFADSFADTGIGEPFSCTAEDRLIGADGRETPDTLKIEVYQDYTMAYEVLSIVNAERQKAGVDPLVMDESLMDSAMHRASETVVLMSHGRPDGTLCFTINPNMLAENYAWGFKNPQSVMEGWMDSPGHKANILNADYSGVGIGCIKYNGAYHWVQCFGTTSQTEDCTQPEDGSIVSAINMPYNTFTDPYKHTTVTFSFSIMPSGKTMIIGETRDLDLKMDNVTFLDGEDSVYWRSSDESVATVDENGVVTGVAAGKAVITASSKYLDRQSLSMTITVAPENMRIYGYSRVDTSIEAAKKLKKKLGTDKFDSIIVASGLKYADALSGSWLSAVETAPVLLVDSSSEDKVANYVKSNIASDGTVYILGGTGVVPESFAGKLEGLNVKRLFGKSRFETNMAILEETDTEGQELLVCSGYGYADALSVSSVGKPILLVGPELTEEQASYLETAGFSKIYAIGGTGAVSADIVSSLEEYAEVTRIGGKSRFDTSLNVATTFFPGQHDYMMMVYAMDFPDGLSGGPLAHQYDAPVILAMTSNIDAASSFRVNSAATRSITMGGPKLISDEAIFVAMGNNTPIQVN